jgi:hypothetical protein
MKKQEIINNLIVNRQNNLSVKRVEVVKTKNSLGNPYISVGTLPFYEWDKDKQITFVITYGRYLNCEMMVYSKQIKNDADFVIIKGTKKAIEHLQTILK